MWVHSLPMKGGKGLGHDGFDTFASQAGHVYDITDTDREHWAQNGGTCVGSCCHNFQTLISNQQDKKSSEKLLRVYFLLHSSQQDLLCFLASLPQQH